MCARYAGLADANGSLPGGDLARDADALRLPHLACLYAIRVSRRGAAITITRVLYGAARVYLPSRALTRWSPAGLVRRVHGCARGRAAGPRRLVLPPDDGLHGRLRVRRRV
jgi:hypothetical protein